MRKQTVEAIRAHAAACYPRESCGLVVLAGKSEKYLPCHNAAADNDHFVISAADYAEAEDQGTVVAVVHSHPDESDMPSVADERLCDESGLSWLIVSVMQGEAAATVRRIEPQNQPTPLLGRAFSHGVQDCYTLVRDFYQREMDITLPDFERADDWWSRGQDLYMDNFTQAGFYRLKDHASLQFGDVLLMQVRSDVANHAGVFIGAVQQLDGRPVFPALQNAFIHHLYDRLSTRDVYGGYWKDNTLAVIRYAANT